MSLESPRLTPWPLLCVVPSGLRAQVSLFSFLQSCVSLRPCPRHPGDRWLTVQFCLWVSPGTLHFLHYLFLGGHWGSFQVLLTWSSLPSPFLGQVFLCLSVFLHISHGSFPSRAPQVTPAQSIHRFSLRPPGCSAGCSWFGFSSFQMHCSPLALLPHRRYRRRTRRRAGVSTPGTWRSVSEPGASRSSCQWAVPFVR